MERQGEGRVLKNILPEPKPTSVAMGTIWRSLQGLSKSQSMCPWRSIYRHLPWQDIWHPWENDKFHWLFKETFHIVLSHLPSLPLTATGARRRPGDEDVEQEEWRTHFTTFFLHSWQPSHGSRQSRGEVLQTIWDTDVWFWKNPLRLFWKEPFKTILISESIQKALGTARGLGKEKATELASTKNTDGQERKGSWFLRALCHQPID